MERRGGIGQVFGSLPLPQQLMLGAAIALLAMGAFMFYQWVSTPTYSLLYSDLDDQSLAEVVDELERMDIPYEIDGAGSRVLVPRSEVYGARAALASAGVRSRVVPEGYERFDNQGLNTSEFQQQVTYQLALEGELAKTLMAMDNIETATVHLSIPEEALFQEDEEEPTASVLIATARPISEPEVETVTYLVAASIEGLTAQNVTVADVGGTVLHAAGVEAGSSTMTSRNMRMTRDFEDALARDVEDLLVAVLGPGRSRVVVRADLDFDETSLEEETFNHESASAIKESTSTETYNGTGTPPGGTVGVDGAEVVTEDSEGYAYDRSDTITEYGVDRSVARTVAAPGTVTRLTAAVLIDDGSLTGGTAADATEVSSLVAAAIGVDAARGDEVTVSTAAFPAPELVGEPEELPAAASSPTDMLPQIVGGVVLALIAVALLLMARSTKKSVATTIDVESIVPSGLPGGSATPAMVAAAAAIDQASSDPALPQAVPDGSIQPEVIDLVQKQPEEIAVLLRGWLADRR